MYSQIYYHDAIQLLVIHLHLFVLVLPLSTQLRFQCRCVCLQAGIGSFLPSPHCLEYMYSGGRQTQSLQQLSTHPPHPPPLPVPPTGKYDVSFDFG